MGTVMHRLVQLGEYCDCLQNWKKYEESPEENASDFYISENLSNIQLPLQKVFRAQVVQNGFDKQLQILQQRLNKRKRLKADYIKQRQKQRLLQQKQDQKNKQEKLKQIQLEKQILIKQEELRKIRQQETQKLRKQRMQKKIKANKRNKKFRDRYKTKQTDPKLTIVNKQLSTTDENILNFMQSDSNPDENNEQQQQQNFNQQEYQQEDQQINQKQEQQIEEESQSQQKDEKAQKSLKYDIRSQIGYKGRQKDKGLEIIDFSKLDPQSMKDQISQLVLKKINLNADERLKSQTIPLNQTSVQSHRVRGHTLEFDIPKRRYQGHLQFPDKRQQQFDCDEMYFGESEISHKKTVQYFLDDQDKEEYFKRRV